MEEKYIQLIEKYFEKTLSSAEDSEFNNLLNNDSVFAQAFEEQKKIKEVFNTMKLKSPNKELWDNYWENTYNNLERGLGWLAVFIGALILLGFASVEFVNHLYEDGNTPVIIKIGTVSLVFGFLVLFFSIIREKLFTYKNDKYKEIKR